MLWGLLRCWHIVFPTGAGPATSCAQLPKTPQHVARVACQFKPFGMVEMRAWDTFSDPPSGGGRVS